MSKRSIFISALFALAVLAPPALAHTTVRVDRSFSSGGVVEGKFGSHYSQTAFTSLQPQADGSLLAGRTEGSEALESIRRYHPDGSLDTSFAPQQINRQVEAVDADGKVLRAVDGALERFEPDGTPDPSFGTRPYGSEKISDAPGFKIEQIVPLPSGKILAGGSIVVQVVETRESPGYTYVEQVAVARFEPEGRLDAGFGTGGVVKLKSDAGVAGERLSGLAARSDGGVEAIVLDSLRNQWGESVSHSGSTIVCLGVDGRLDPSYGSGGSVRLETVAILASHALAGNELLVAGDRWGSRLEPRSAHESDVFLARYTGAGQLDPGFGAGDGSATLNMADIDLLGAMLVEEDGSVLLGGSASVVKTANCIRFFDICRETPFVARFTPAGSPAPGFGNGGLLMLTPLSWSYGIFEGGVGVQALAARPGGGVLAAGGSGLDAFIAAISPAGALEPSFGSGGIVVEREPSPSRSAAHAVAVDRRERLLVAGGTDADVAGYAPEGAVFRYLPDGELDRSFGEGDGYVRLPGPGSDLALAADGATFALSRGNALTVTKVSGDGRIDSSFGEEGTAELPGAVPIRWRGRRRSLYVDPVSIVPLPGGRVLVAATASKVESRLVLFRLRADGRLDPSFGNGGIVIQSFGAAGDCAVNQMVLQPNGRFLLAGHVEAPSGASPRSEALAVMRLLPNGEKDRSFGRNGLVVKRIGQRSYASALALQGGKGIIVAGRSGVRGGVREVLLRLRSNGRLDRGFGRRGIASARVPLKPGGFSNRPRQVLLLHGRILVLRDSPGAQLVASSGDGRRRHAYAVARHAKSGGRTTRAPFGALQAGRLVLGWEVYGSPPSYFKLQRLQIRGRP